MNSLSAGIRLTRPLTWGRDFSLDATAAEAQAAEALVTEARRDADLELTNLNFRIENLNLQLEQIGELENQSRSRVENFEDQFLGGSANIIEAVGIIDTYKRIVRNKIETRFALLSAQREKVQLLGLLGPYATVKPFEP